MLKNIKYMKKIVKFFYFLLLVCFLLVTTQGLVYAITPDTDKQERLQQREEERNRLREEKRVQLEAKIEAKVAERERKKEMVRERIEEHKASAAARLAVKKQERIRVYFGRLVLRLQSTVDRLNVLVNRIESRILKINEGAEGANTSSITVQLDEARLLLDQADAEILAAQDNLETMLASDDPKAAFEAIRDSIKNIKDLLKDVHSILVHTIGDIRGLRVGNTESVVGTTTATPFPTTEATPTDEPEPTVEITETPIPVE